MPITPIDKQAFGEGGAVIVSGTTQTIPAGDYCAMQCVADTTITTALNAPLLTGTQTSISYPAGLVLFTPITGGTGAITGTAIFYKAL
jgi:hypothetical protein